MEAFRLLVLVAVLALSACSPSDAVLLAQASSAPGQVATARESLNAALRWMTTQGTDDMRRAGRAAEGLIAGSDRPGSIDLVFEDSRVVVRADPDRPASRAIRLEVRQLNGGVRYLALVDSRLWNAKVASVQEGALYVYGALLQRESLEAILAAAPAGADPVTTLSRPGDLQASGMLRGQYAAWPAVYLRAYGPMRAANVVPPLPNFEAFGAAHAACSREPNPSACILPHVRAFLGI